MIAQQLLGLVQELAFMLCAGSFITPSQLPQNLYPCRLTHCFIHSGHGNPTSGATYPFTALCTSSRVTKLLAQFDQCFKRFSRLPAAPGWSNVSLSKQNPNFYETIALSS